MRRASRLLVLATGLVAFVGPRNDGDAAPIVPTIVATTIDAPTIATRSDDLDRPSVGERRRRRPIRMHRELLDFAPAVPAPRTPD